MSVQKLRDAIARIDGIATTPDGMLTWASAERLAEELMPFLAAHAAAELRSVARDLGPVAAIAGDGPHWNPHRVVELLADHADRLER